MLVSQEESSPPLQDSAVATVFPLFIRRLWILESITLRIFYIIAVFNCVDKAVFYDKILTINL